MTWRTERAFLRHKRRRSRRRFNRTVRAVSGGLGYREGTMTSDRILAALASPAGVIQIRKAIDSTREVL